MDELKKIYRIELRPKNPSDRSLRSSASYNIQSVVLHVNATSLTEACERAENDLSTFFETQMTTVSAYEALWGSSDEEKGALGDDIDDE